MKRGIRIFSAVLVFSCVSSLSQAFVENGGVQITEIRIAHNIDQNFQPVKTSRSFGPGTSKVFCWFKWKSGEINAPIRAEWFYITGRMPVVDYKVVIPRFEGAGGIALSMPEGKTLPAGEYEVRLVDDHKTILKAARFIVAGKKS